MKLMVQNFEEVKSNSYNYDVNTVVIMDRLKYIMLLKLPIILSSNYFMFTYKLRIPKSIPVQSILLH